MYDSQLTTWIHDWSGQYGVAHDDQLHGLMGRASLDREAFQRIIDWKFPNQAHRRTAAYRRRAEETDAALLDFSAASRQCGDDGAALRIILGVSGVGPALGSALLMVMNSQRWTVLDVRALASVRAVGYPEVPDNPQNRATWLPYLEACRAIHQRTQLPLRTVDRALWAANGRPHHPDHESSV